MPPTTLGTFLRRLKETMAAEALAPLSDRELVGQFLATRDEAAFQAILHRHGPMVFRVCRRVLPQEQDAEDAFQATFLVLAREARTIRKQASLASWLHGVAYRAALKARARIVRRHQHEAQAAGPTRPTLPDDVCWKELRLVLDEELARLPERLRAPLVLCYLEGVTQDEAAHQLGWSKSTCRRNLERGRELLGRRLARRGVTLSAALFASFLSECAAAAVPAVLFRATVQAALPYAAGKAAAACVASAGVVTLLQGAAKPMFWSKLKVAMSILFVGCLVGGAAVLAHRSADARPPQDLPRSAGDAPKPAAGKDVGQADVAKKEAAQPITVRGRVLDPDGKPFAGAKLYLGAYGPKDTLTFAVRATSGADGRFDFTFKRSELSKAVPDQPVGRLRNTYTLENLFVDPDGLSKARVGQLAAVAEGSGSYWVRVNGPDATDELTLRLVKDVPVRGRILDQDGKPVAGAKLRVLMLQAYPGEDLGGVLEAVRTKNVIGTPEARRWVGPLPGQAETVTTDAAGRFRVSGLGRERVVMFGLEGPAIAHIPFQVMTREGETVLGPGKDVSPLGAQNLFRLPPVKLYAATFSHLAPAARPIRGVVRDKETGKPLPGVRLAVKAATGPVAPPAVGGATGRTDADGRYELLGMAKSEAYVIHVLPETGTHFAVGVRVDDTPGLGPLTADIQVPRGVVRVRGRVTDKATGKPVPGARVYYFPLFPNGEATRLSDYTEFQSVATAGADGSFTVPGLPGSGILGAVAPSAEAYQPAQVTPGELEAFLKKFNEPLPTWGVGPQYLPYVGRPEANAGPGILLQRSFHALSLIHPAPKDQAVTCDLVLHP